MTQTIALAGKGGVGKTTVTGMLIQYLCAKKKGAFHYFKILSLRILSLK